MKNNTPLRLAGVSFRVHPLFWLVIIASAATGYFLEILTLFAIVLIHEMGHVYSAKAYHWHVQEVALLPFGGVAKVEEQGETPVREEMVVALSGPLMNLLMVPFALFFYRFGWWDVHWTRYFLTANLWIAGFNLLPLYPLDGGKILLDGFYRIAPYYRSLHWIVWLGMFGSCMMMLIACVRVMWEQGLGMNLLILGLYVLYENWQEYRQIPYRMFRFLLHRYEGPVDVRNFSLTRVFFQLDEKVRQLTERMYRERRHLFCAREEGGPICLIEEEFLRIYFEEEAPQKKIRELLR